MCQRTKILCLSLLLALSPLFAQAKNNGGNGRGHGHDKHERAEEAAPAANISIGITLGGARDLVRGAGVQPGQYQALPPGMYKRLAKGKALPPGIAKKQPPAAMLSRLPVHPGHEWLVIGVDLVLFNVQTRIPVDILPGVF